MYLLISELPDVREHQLKLKENCKIDIVEFLMRQKAIRTTD